MRCQCDFCRHVFYLNSNTKLYILRLCLSHVMCRQIIQFEWIGSERSHFIEHADMVVTLCKCSNVVTLVVKQGRRPKQTPLHGIIDQLWLKSTFTEKLRILLHFIETIVEHLYKVSKWWLQNQGLIAITVPF